MNNYGRSSRQLNNSGTCRLLVFLLVMALGLTGCSNVPAAPAVPAEVGAVTLTLYNWVDYMPQSVLDAFADEYGIQVIPVVYESQEEVVENLRAGNAYDLLILGVEYIPTLIEEGLVVKIDQRNVPNIRNIAANFRDLDFDPGNHYAIPFHWGTTGLLVRNDLVEKLPTRWADLWNAEYEGKVAIWPLQESLLPIALKKLGYSVNTEDPDQVQAAFAELNKLQDISYFIGNDNATVIQDLVQGKAVLAYGWAYDALLAEEKGLPIEYVLPEEGSVLWSDYLMIPVSSSHKAEAELFINFLLRPEISAQLVEESYYPSPNEAARAQIDPTILANPIIHPLAEDLVNAEMTLPLSDAGRQLRDAAWRKFISSP